MDTGKVKRRSQMKSIFKPFAAKLSGFRMRSVENVILKKILYVFVWILGCIENCLQYINYNVFTVISYSGFSFCPAAKMVSTTSEPISSSDLHRFPDL